MQDTKRYFAVLKGMKTQPFSSAGGHEEKIAFDHWLEVNMVTAVKISER